MLERAFEGKAEKRCGQRALLENKHGLDAVPECFYCAKFKTVQQQLMIHAYMACRPTADLWIFNIMHRLLRSMSRACSFAASLGYIVSYAKMNVEQPSLAGDSSDKIS